MSSINTFHPAKTESKDVVCLGFDGLNLVYFSPVLETVVSASADRLSAQHLLATCGRAWLTQRFGATKGSANTNAFGFDTSAVVEYLVAGCHRAGAFSPASVRPEGFYRDGDALVVNTGSEQFSCNGRRIRPAPGVVYVQAGQGLGFSSATAPANRRMVAELDRLLASWKWRFASEAELVRGWLAAACYGAALDRRPHLCITGPRGVGKTVLRDVAGALFGPAALTVDGSSTAVGIVQALNGRSIPVLVDEAEVRASDSLRQMVALARSSYSAAGDGRVVGTGGGKAKALATRSSFLFSCIQPPAFEASDASRWVMAEIVALRPAAAVVPCRLVSDEAFRVELGARLRMLLVRRWPVFAASLPLFRDEVLAKRGDARLADTLAPVLAGNWTLKHGQAATAADAEAEATRLLPKAAQETEANADEQDCLRGLLTRLVSARGGRVSVAEMVQRAGSGNPLADIELQRLGIRVMAGREGWSMCLPVSESHRGLHSLFVGTRYASGGWAAVLKRLPGARCMTQRVLGMATKVVAVPVPAELLAMSEWKLAA